MGSAPNRVSPAADEPSEIVTMITPVVIREKGRASIDFTSNDVTEALTSLTVNCDTSHGQFRLPVVTSSVLALRILKELLPSSWRKMCQRTPKPPRIHQPPPGFLEQNSIIVHCGRVFLLVWLTQSPATPKQAQKRAASVSPPCRRQKFCPLSSQRSEDEVQLQDVRRLQKSFGVTHQVQVTLTPLSPNLLKHRWKFGDSSPGIVAQTQLQRVKDRVRHVTCEQVRNRTKVTGVTSKKGQDGDGSGCPPTETNRVESKESGVHLPGAGRGGKRRGVELRRDTLHSRAGAEQEHRAARAEEAHSAEDCLEDREELEDRDNLEDSEDLRDKDKLAGRKNLEDKDELEGRNNLEDKDELGDKDEMEDGDNLEDSRELGDKDEIEDSEDLRDKDELEGRNNLEDKDELEGRDNLEDSQELGDKDEIEDRDNLGDSEDLRDKDELEGRNNLEDSRELRDKDETEDSKALEDRDQTEDREEPEDGDKWDSVQGDTPDARYEPWLSRLQTAHRHTFDFEQSEREEKIQRIRAKLRENEAALRKLQTPN